MMGTNDKIRKYAKKLKLNLRNKFNPLFAPCRRYIGGIKQPFTIISNNCWGGIVYQHYNLSYDSPTIGCYFFAEDYIKFISNLKYYLNLDMSFISYDKSRHKEELFRKKQTMIPIGVLDDVEIVFLHYHSEEEVLKKWNRRKERIHWDNLFFKFSEMNQCRIEHLKAFDEISSDNKLVLVSQDYKLKSQVIVSSYTRNHEVYDDTTNFREGINLGHWLTKRSFKK
nr:DUF1919 domain-containing protein [Bacteroidales bacterium]